MPSNRDEPAPRAVIHKRILDVAAQRPDATVEALAADVPGASPDLVERVLEEYGDPALEAPSAPARSPSVSSAVAPEPASENPSRGAGSNPPSSAESTAERSPAVPVSLAALSADQRATLRAIAESPEATQAELADGLGVSAATVNKRVNAIDGFDWADRRSFVAQLLGDPGAEPGPDDHQPVASATATGGASAAATGGASATATGGPSRATVDGTPPPDEPTSGGDIESDDPPTAAGNGGQLLPPEQAGAVEQLQERVARLEQHLVSGVPTGEALFGERELLVKVIRAVLVDEEISDEEGLRVLEALL